MTAAERGEGKGRGFRSDLGGGVAGDELFVGRKVDSGDERQEFKNPTEAARVSDCF